MSRIDQTEAELQKLVLKYLLVKGYFHWRNFVGGIPRGDKIKGVTFSKNPMKGLPDILGICKNQPGRLFAIELKKPGKEKDLSPEQMDKIAALRRCGALVFVASDLDTVIKTLEREDV